MKRKTGRKSQLRIQFTLNNRSGAITRRSVDTGFRANITAFKNAVVTDLAIIAAEHYWDRIKAAMKTTIEHDVKAELRHLVAIFMRSVVGKTGRTSVPGGSLSMVAPASRVNVGSRVMAVSAGTGTWQKRNPRYIRDRQRREKRSDIPEWFRRPGTRHLPKLANSDLWLKTFGPIEVKITRLANLAPETEVGPQGLTAGNKYQRTAMGVAKGGYGTSKTAAKKRIHVARIEVGAMHRLTPDTLGDFSEGPDFAPMLRFFGKDIADRLRGRVGVVPERRTMQPFLWYFLNRSLPNAVFRRIEVGLGATLKGTMGRGRATVAGKGGRAAVAGAQAYAEKQRLKALARSQAAAKALRLEYRKAVIRDIADTIKKKRTSTRKRK